jgi:GT2 family glycosyltransferase
VIYIVMVNWNGYRDTLECLESLLRLDGDDYRIVVCDNASSDGSTDRFADWSTGGLVVETDGPPWPLLPPSIRKSADVAFIHRGEAFPEGNPLITVVKVGANLGFAGANNIGAAYALADIRTTHVWFLNNDTVVHPQALTALLRKANEDDRIGICAATLFYYCSPETVQGVGVKFNLLTARAQTLGWKQTQATLPDPKFVEAMSSYVIGASMFVSRAFLETVGPMSEDYFLYYEELDWAYRNAGRFRQVWAPEAVVFHKEGATIGTKLGGRASPTSTYYRSVNLLRFVRKFRSAFLPVTAAKIIFEYLRYCVRRDWGNSRVVALAAHDFLTGVRRTGQVS